MRTQDQVADGVLAGSLATTGSRDAVALQHRAQRCKIAIDKYSKEGI